MDTYNGHFVPGVILNGRYKTLSALNHGSFGMVSMAKDKTTGKDVALKCIPKPSAGLGLNSGIKVDDRSIELLIHQKVGHRPNIVNLLDHFETDTYTYLVLEYCAMGDLYEAIRMEKGPKETEHVRSFMLQLIGALEALHAEGVYHRDIKPENIFLTDNGDMKLGDFGLATTDSWSFEIAVGSDRYMAPEQFDPQGYGLDPAKADIWSVGICLLNILFSRNPFLEPAFSDPLYADFARDRQSLFDVFPNMSQDTFEVLRHCLVVDPEKRSLSMVRAALQSLISFTTDDERLDDFCTENREPVVTNTAREPLRTPSLASPKVEQGESFPWAQALHMTSPHRGRPLSVIPDDSYSEDLFPESDASVTDWASKRDSQSVDSVLDSGFGGSLGSIDPLPTDANASKSKPMPIAGSLPMLTGKASSALSSIFSKKRNVESKSWSDMWEEDEEERTVCPQEPIPHSRPVTKASQLSQIDSESDGRSTPRAVFADIKDSPIINSRPLSQDSFQSRDDAISQQTGFIFEDHTPAARYSPPSKRSFMDKWAALGEKRRGVNSTAKDATLSDWSPKKRFNPATWGRNFGRGTYRAGNNRKIDHDVWQKKDWNTSTDWRKSETSSPVKPSPLRSLDATQFDGAASNPGRNALMIESPTQVFSTPSAVVSGGNRRYA